MASGARKTEKIVFAVVKDICAQLYVLFKELSDRSFAIPLVMLSPLLIVVALLVRWRLGSPVLFRQQRPGHYGKPFCLLKFRTMSSARDSSNFLADAQRLTPFGRWLRATSIDELPGCLISYAEK